MKWKKRIELPRYIVYVVYDIMSYNDYWLDTRNPRGRSGFCASYHHDMYNRRSVTGQLKRWWNFFLRERVNQPLLHYYVPANNLTNKLSQGTLFSPEPTELTHMYVRMLCIRSPLHNRSARNCQNPFRMDWNPVIRVHHTKRFKTQLNSCPRIITPNLYYKSTSPWRRESATRVSRGRMSDYPISSLSEPKGI